MLILLSPAKSLDFATPAPTPQQSELRFPQATQELVAVLQNKTVAQIQELMELSENLAELNFQRFQGFYGQPTKPALFAFAGDVYQGLQAASLSGQEIERAQARVRILSGLYGILKPLDPIWPYRLEMGTRLALPQGVGLYRFWGSRIAEAINQEERQWVVNLASEEYFKAVDKKTLQATVITPQFLDEKKGQYKVISFHAKEARGLMTRYLLQENVQQPEGLVNFDQEGYRYSPERSSKFQPTFIRPENWREQL